MEKHAFVKAELADFWCVFSRKIFQRDRFLVYFSTLWAVKFSFFHNVILFTDSFIISSKPIVRRQRAKIKIFSWNQLTLWLLDKGCYHEFMQHKTSTNEIVVFTVWKLRKFTVHSVVMTEIYPHFKKFSWKQFTKLLWRNFCKKDRGGKFFSNFHTVGNSLSRIFGKKFVKVTVF